MVELIRTILADFRGAWRALVVTDLAYKVAAFVVIAPLTGLVLRAVTALSGDAAITDTGILDFVLSPVGLAGMIVVAGVMLTATALGLACLMVVGLGQITGRHVSVTAAIGFGLRRAVPVLGVALRMVVVVLLIAAPFLAAAGLVFVLMLTEFDINYYLQERPPRFWAAASIIGLLLVGLVAVVLPAVASWSIALPLVLFEDVRPRSALRTSAERLRGHALTIVSSMVIWAVATGLLSTATLAVVGLAGRLILPAVSGPVTVLLVIVGCVVLTWAIANIAVAVVQSTTFALLIMRVYLAFGDARAPTDGSLELPAEPTLRILHSRSRVIGAAVLAVMAATVIGGWLLHGVRLEEDVLVIAHRGASVAAPENTLAAVERAVLDGADIVEIDVQETADGEVVVFHDSDFMKIAGRDRKLWDATSDWLHDVDIGSWFDPSFADQRVPRLADVLELCRDSAVVDIELKYYGHDDQLEQRVVDIVESAGMADQVVIMSLEYPAVRKMKSLRPRWTVGLLAATAVGDLTRLEADFLAVDHRMARRSFVRRAHDRGKDVYVWTVNDPLLMSRMMSVDVDGIITDDPGLARRVIAHRAELDVVQRLLLDLSIRFGADPHVPAWSDAG